MEQKETARKVEELTQKIFEIMGFQAEVSIGEPTSPIQGSFVCRIHVKENSNLLIGQHGINLEALQHIIHVIARRRFDADMPFILDINSYWDDKSRLILAETREAANQVERDRAAVIMRPMSGFERKMVHTELADNPHVTTESIGTGENRKVVIKPTSLLEE